MGGIRELRGRIKSVGSIRQITRAMEMVATTKLRRFQDRALSSRPYADEITALVGHLAQVLGDELANRPLFRDGEGAATAILLVTSDRGLVRRSYVDRLLADPNGERTTLDGSKLWQVALLELWLRKQGV